LESIAQRAEQNQRLAELMERPVFVGRRGMDSLELFPSVHTKCHQILGIHGNKAIIHSHVGATDSALEDLVHARLTFGWVEELKCYMDMYLATQMSWRFSLAV